MKFIKLFFLIFVGISTSKSVVCQNVLLNILTQNSGTVTKNGTTFLEVTVCNTSASISVPAYKLKPQLSFPSELVSIQKKGHVLPTGWSILNNINDSSVIRLTNGTDQIPANECRTILIAIKGKSIGGPSTITGTLTFSNGIEPGSAAGGALKGDNPADNSSTTSIKVLH
jgi:hypothetical protein